MPTQCFYPYIYIYIYIYIFVKQLNSIAKDYHTCSSTGTQTAEKIQALRLGNICMVDGSWTSTAQFSRFRKIAWGRFNLQGHRTCGGARQHYTRNWKC